MPLTSDSFSRIILHVIRWKIHKRGLFLRDTKLSRFNKSCDVCYSYSTLKNMMHLPSEVCPQPLTRAITPAKSGGFGLRQGSFTGLMKSETFTQISEEIC